MRKQKNSMVAHGSMKRHAQTRQQPNPIKEGLDGESEELVEKSIGLKVRYHPSYST